MSIRNVGSVVKKDHEMRPKKMEDLTGNYDW
jgi:hypothetical protein